MTHEERIRELEHNSAEFIANQHALGMLCYALFLTHPNKKAVCDATGLLDASFGDAMLFEPVPDSLRDRASARAQQMLGILERLAAQM